MIPLLFFLKTITKLLVVWDFAKEKKHRPVNLAENKQCLKSNKHNEPNKDAES